jgi:hypothetical protein
MFIVAAMKNLLPVDEVGYAGARYNQLYNFPPCLSGEEGCVICPTILEEAADRGARIDDRVFLLVSDFECNCVRFYLQSVQIFSVFYILTVL